MNIKKITRCGIDFLVDYNERDSFFWDINGWESKNYELIIQLSKDNRIFVHAGGWIGPFTLFAAKLFENVIVLEPDPVSLDQLKKNVSLNNFGNVTIINSAFSNDKKNIRIGSSIGLGKSNTSIFEASNSVEVTSSTVREIYENNKITNSSVLMLDVEGSEYLLFDDINFYRNYSPHIILSLHLSWLNDENYYRMMSGIEKMSEIYDFDINYIKSMRKVLQYGSSFSDVSILFTPKK